ncbi:Uma2 family endonuclease [Azospirillum picis]|uniref:Uma2 family endonuclease n=1 Tax=Azospirillum picis TaxID=488438 RepID=A0ABU0MJZ4_9PROT|nr:Uma2 family endonuclease [Azospirillum picis]MBP2299976.1 Uma2 family endonuclease [Azospirillum picis]MDQ0533786.1 Uma2 family endonuclease [Azospirillum picis]
MADAQRKAWISPQDYLAGERVAEVRHEYVDGEIFAMVGAGRRHATIVGNLFVVLRQAARANGGRAYANDVKVRVEAANAFYYPDLIATCADGDDDPYVVKHPVLIVEVLSDSTEAIDRREKRTNYQRIPSLREIVLVSQADRRVEIYRRDHGGWVTDVVTEGTVHLASVAMSVPLDALYED